MRTPMLLVSNEHHTTMFFSQKRAGAFLCFPLPALLQTACLQVVPCSQVQYHELGRSSLRRLVFEQQGGACSPITTLPVPGWQSRSSPGSSPGVCLNITPALGKGSAARIREIPHSIRHQSLQFRIHPEPPRPLPLKPAVGQAPNHKDRHQLL